MHLVGMFIEIGFEGGHIALTNLAEHPAYSLVDEVVGMGKENSGEAEGVVVLVGTYEHPACHHGDALFPQVGAFGKLVEDFAVGHRAVGLGK